jgi:hypothetical protein
VGVDLVASGWARRAVRGVQVVQGVSWSARNRGVRLQQGFLKQLPRFAWILLLLLPNTKGQGRGGDATVIFVQRVVVVLD